MHLTKTHSRIGYIIAIYLISISGYLSAQFKEQKISNEDIMFTAFAQNTAEKGVGNCASIAIIKAAILTFGIDGVFSQEFSNDAYTITLKNNKVIKISTAEHTLAQEYASFVLSNDPSEEVLRIYEYAVLCYAVMAKMKFLLDYSVDDYQDALIELGNGEYAPHIYLLLGLDGHVRTYLWYTHGRKIQSGISWRRKHAVFISKNSCDINGERKSLFWHLRLHGRQELLNFKIG